MYKPFENMAATGACPILYEKFKFEKVLGDPEGFAKALTSAGLFTIEFAIRFPEALDMIEQLTPALKRYGLMVGLGTASSMDQVRRALDVGVSFIVSPGFNDQIAAHSKGQFAYMPGAETYTELEHAYLQGFETLKYYPATSMSMCGVFCSAYPNARVIASEVKDAGDSNVMGKWFHKGVSAIVYGNTRLFESLDFAHSDPWERVHANADGLVKLIRLARKK